MTNKTLDDCILEAERFLKRAKACKKYSEGRIKEEQANKTKPFGGRSYEFVSNKVFASAKRSSMDLSMALIELRKGGIW